MRIKLLLVLVTAAEVIGLTPTPQEQSTMRRYQDSTYRDYNGTVGDSKTHTLKCTAGQKAMLMHIYFIVRENVDPSTRGVIANIPGLAQFYLEYFSQQTDEFFLIFKPEATMASPEFPTYKYLIKRNVWSSFVLTYSDVQKV